MTTIREHAEQYLAMRRALGFKLESFGPRLLSFVAFLEETGQTALTTQTALDWAIGASRSPDQVIWSRRLMVVRSFARHLSALDPSCEVPPPDVLPHHYRRVAPHLFTDQQIAALMDAAGRLRPAFRALTWRTLIGLLPTTGLRVGEACRLDVDNVDLADATLEIGDTKFGKSRLVPIHTTTAEALAEYDRRRRERFGRSVCPAFLLNSRGQRVDEHNLSHAFNQIAENAGLHAAEGRRRPRLADMRHTFATATLLDWYRDGGDVAARLPLLATYLGHADPKSTYWYLSGSPELLAEAASRLAGAFGGAA